MPRKKLSLVLIVLSLFTFAGGCATAPRSSGYPQEEQGFVSLKSLCVRYNLDWTWDALAQMVTLKLPEGDARLMVGSSLVITDEEKIFLNAEVKMRDSEVMVTGDFISKVVERYKQQPTRAGSYKDYAISTVSKVVIDAGHGGKDPGATGISGTREKEVVLDISKRLQRLLQRENIQVVMTRDTDEFISLAGRTEIASRANADLFISIHANASPQASVHGFEVFSLKDLGYFEQNEEQMVRNQKITCDHLKMSKDKNVQTIVVDMIRSRKKAESISLAMKISQHLPGTTNSMNRGMKTAKFYVLRNTLIPSVLVEVGFLTNSKEERLLQTGAYRQKIAEGLAKSILYYAKN